MTCDDSLNQRHTHAVAAHVIDSFGTTLDVVRVTGYYARH